MSYSTSMKAWARSSTAARAGKNDTHSRTRRAAGSNAKDQRQRQATAALVDIWTKKR